MRITFLTLPDTPGRRIHRQYAGGFGTVEYIVPGSVTTSTLMPPMFSANAAAMVEQMGHHAQIVDAQAQGLDPEGTVREALETRPDLIVTRPSLPALLEDSRVIESIASEAPDPTMILWGAVARSLTRRILGIPGVDACLLGELEFCLPGVVSALSSSPSGKLSGLPGVALREGSGIASTPPAPPGSLDDLPLPAHHLLDMSHYRTLAHKFAPVSADAGEGEEPFYTILTSRGCNYRCIYCPYMVIYDHGWRGMGPQRAVDEIEELVTCHGIRNIWFLDEVLTQDYDRIERICNMIIDRGLDVAWRCESRVDRLPRSLLELMRRAGCGTIQLGVETGDPRLLPVGKPGSSIPRIEETFRNLREVGIQARASAMVGLPGESWESVRMTAKLLDRIRPVSVEIGVSTPYPGTPFYDLARKEGWICEEDFARYTISEPVTSLPGFPAGDIARARRYLLDRYLIRNRLRKSLTPTKRGRLDAIPRALIPGSLRESIWRIENFVRVRARM